MPVPRLLIIGLDCAEPTLVFEQWRAELPNLAGLMERGVYGRLESCIPAITVPAWSCMLSGRDPGELGIYGFRNRADRSYGKMAVADGRAVRFPRLWDLLGDAGWRTAVVGVPGTFPPPQRDGAFVACFLAPSVEAEYTHPPELAARIAGWVADPAIYSPEAGAMPRSYLLDVPNFRSEDKARILSDIYAMCDQRFAVAARLLEEQRPDLLMLVEMGVDRIHHAFWKEMDARHPLYIPGSPFANVIRDYYHHVDAHIGALLQHCDKETLVLVVSDHGARPLMGGVRINEWLRGEGYLTLADEPVVPMPFDQVAVAWGQTKAWGAGGYYARIFLNVRGREPEGLIAPADYAAEREQLATRLSAMAGPDGAPLGNRVFMPQQLYRSVRGVAPDLIVYLADLAWRAVGTVGGKGLYTIENDTGPDDANHAQEGLFILYDPGSPGAGRSLTGAEIYDILPTLLARFDLPVPQGLRGQVIRL